MGLSDQVGLERIDGDVIVSFPNELAFPSGSSGMTEEFAAVLNRVTPVINQTDGEVHIAGHTDNIPVSSSSPYISNWDLSAARATSVLHHMIDQNGTEPSRMVIQGYGDSRPIATNDTPEGRSQNRRVAITIEMVESNKPDEAANGSAAPTGQNGEDAAQSESSTQDGPTTPEEASTTRRRTFSIPGNQ